MTTKDTCSAARTIVQADSGTLRLRSDAALTDLKALLDARGHGWDAILTAIADLLDYDIKNMGTELLSVGGHYPTMARVIRACAGNAMLVDRTRAG